MTASVLTKAGIIPGFSPHPTCIYLMNAFVLTNRLISNDEIVEFFPGSNPKLKPVNREATYGKITTFEITTCLGFYYFAQKKS